MQLFCPHLRLRRNHPEAFGLIELAEVVEEAVSESLSASDPNVLIVGLWPSCWRRDPGELGRQLIKDGNKLLRLQKRY